MSLYKDLYKYKLIKKYDLTKSMNDLRRNEGRDYSDNLLKNSLSNHIQRKDTMRDFIGFLQDVFVENVKTVTKLKLFKAFAMPKDYFKVK